MARLVAPRAVDAGAALDDADLGAGQAHEIGGTGAHVLSPQMTRCVRRCVSSKKVKPKR